MSIETIINPILNIVIICEGLAALLSLVYYKNYTNRYLKFLPILLISIFINEFLSVYVIQSQSTALVYNVLSFMTFNYYLWVYRNAYVNTVHIRVSLFLAVIINLSYIIEFFSNGFGSTSLVYSYSLGGIIMIISTVFYFMKKLEQENSLHLKTDILFWISTGNLLFYVGYLPIKLSRIFYSDINDHLINLHLLHLLLIIILNTCLILGFKWAQKNL
jgi:hypothetical protein